MHSFHFSFQAGKKYAEVSLDGFHFFNLPKSYYLFRHTAALTSMTEPEWDLATNFGDIPDVNGYAIDPYFFKKNIDATGFADPDSYYEQFSGNLGTGDNLAWNGEAWDNLAGIFTMDSIPTSDIDALFA